MGSVSYKNLLIRTINAEEYDKKDELIPLLQRASFTFEQTSIFNRRRWNQCSEYLTIRVTPERKQELEEHNEYLRSKCFEIYEESDEFDLEDIFIKSGAGESSDVIIQDIRFEDQQKYLIDAIAQAKYMIWIAVAWFTDRILFDALKKKRDQGLNVQVIIIDDDINAKSGLPLESLFETYRIPPSGAYKNIMHHKFCIIDMKTVAHGSYNWTNKAQYNMETVVVENNQEMAETFAEQFIRVKAAAMSNRK
jgi:phosphatidylserine/phosphatidylglycerophosphate/cardiolipin synthase-like enzyme